MHGAHLSVSFFPRRGPHVGTPSPPSAQVMCPPPRVFSLLPHAPVYSSGRQLLSEEHRPKSCPKSFIAVASPGSLENLSLWPLLSSTAKPTPLPSPSVLHMLWFPVASPTSFLRTGPPSPRQRRAGAESCSKPTSSSFPFGRERRHADHLRRSPSGAASTSTGFSWSPCASPAA
jgi:hypothetical protein